MYTVNQADHAVCSSVAVPQKYVKMQFALKVAFLSGLFRIWYLATRWIQSIRD